MKTSVAICMGVLLLSVAQQACGVLDHDMVPQGHRKGPHVQLGLRPVKWQPYTYNPMTGVTGQAGFPGAAGHHHADHQPGPHGRHGMPFAMHSLMGLQHLPMMMSDSKLGRKLEAAAQGCEQCASCRDCYKCTAAPAIAAKYAAYCGGSDPGACKLCQSKCPASSRAKPSKYSGCAVCKGCCELFFGTCDACRFCSACSRCP